MTTSQRPLVVDARVLMGSGIGRYVRTLVPLLVERGDFSDIILAGDEGELRTFAQSIARPVQIRVLPGGRYSFASQLGWTRLQRSLSPDAIYWFPHWDAPVWLPGVTSVVTVHDLIHLLVPGSADWMRRAVMRSLVPWVTTRAQRVICDSHHTRTDLERLVPALAGKVRVAPCGVDAVFAERSDSPLPARLNAPYLFCVANRKLHKNIEMAVRTLRRVAGETDLQLVVAGQGGAHWATVMALAASLGVAERVIDVGLVDDLTLRALYQRAECLLFPSRYEGFGLPILEAMAAGTPVVAARTSSIPEVAGDAARLVEDNDDAAMAREVMALRESAAHRAQCIERGRLRAASFSWERCAAETAAVLLEAAS